MKTRFKKDELCESILELYPFMSLGDRRPYQTLSRYLSAHNMRVGADAAGQLYLFYQYGAARQTTFGDICLLCRRWAKESLAVAKTNYAYLMVEEDLSEIQLIKKLWEQHFPPMRKDAPTGNGPQPPSSGEIDTGLAMQAQLDQAHDWAYDGDDDESVKF